MAKGFNKGQQMGGGGMMQQLQNCKADGGSPGAQLAVETVTATAGGGAIKVTMTGDQKCQSVEISRLTAGCRCRDAAGSGPVGGQHGARSIA
jgi:hypothetical protein